MTPALTEDEFWALINEVNSAANGDPEAKEKALEARLRALEPEAVLAFGEHFDAKFDQAYTWPLWAAAYIIEGGCSDDGFMDFRSCVVFLGRDAYEAALEAPDSLAAQDDDVLEDLFYEGLQYAHSTVYEEKAGKSRPRRTNAPQEPPGENWDEDDEEQLKQLCPRLFERFWA